jgi:hypothetical protein
MLISALSISVKRNDRVLPTTSLRPHNETINASPLDTVYGCVPYIAMLRHMMMVYRPYVNCRVRMPHR